MFNLLYMLGYHFSGDYILSNGKIILDTLGGSHLDQSRCLFAAPKFATSTLMTASLNVVTIVEHDVTCFLNVTLLATYCTCTLIFPWDITLSGDYIYRELSSSNGKIILDTLGGSLLSFQENKLPRKSPHLWTFISFWTFMFQIKKRRYITLVLQNRLTCVIHMLFSVRYVSCDFQCMQTYKWYLLFVDNLYKIIFKLLTLVSKETH